MSGLAYDDKFNRISKGIRETRIALGDELNKSVLKAKIERLQPVWDHLKTNPDTHKLLNNFDIEVSFEDFHFGGKLHIIFRNRIRRSKPPLLLSIITDDGKSFETICALQNPYKMLHNTVKGFDDSLGTSAAEKIAAYILRIHETLMMSKEDIFNIFNKIDTPFASVFRDKNIDGELVLACHDVLVHMYSVYCPGKILTNETKIQLNKCIEKLIGNAI